MAVVNYTYTTISFPNSSTTFPLGIDSLGRIVGGYDYNNVEHSFILINGTYTSFDPPLATGGSEADGINASNQVVGSYANIYGNHGYLFNPSNGTYTTLDDPYATGGTHATAISSTGEVVGYYVNSSGNHGFLYNNGIYTTLDDPLATEGTEAYGINKYGQIVGDYIDSSGSIHGFLYQNGSYTTLDDPQATVIGTSARGITDTGLIFGEFGGIHSFIYSNGVYTTISEPVGAIGTHVFGVNSEGQIVGYYSTNSGLNGFLGVSSALSAPTLALNNFGTSEGWSNQDQYYRQLIDVNGDGTPDVVGFGSNGVYEALNQGNGSFGSTQLALSDFGTNEGWSSQSVYQRTLVDVNGDGKPDIVGFGSNGVYEALNQGNGTFGSAQPAIGNFGTNEGWSNQDQYPRQLTDVNGDGTPDIVGFGSNGVYVALNQGNGTFGSVQLAIGNFGTNEGWSSQSVYERTLVDVNGDGKPDIVGFGSSGVYVALNQGNGTFGAAQLAISNFGTNEGWSSQDQYPRMLVDVNGDGKPDIVGFGANGVYVALNQGNGTFAPAQLALSDFGTNEGWSSQSVYQRTLVDVNGDGKPDIVGFGSNGVYAALNQGNGTFAPAQLDLYNFGTSQGWSNFGVYPRGFSDINGAGKPDIFGFGTAGLYLSAPV